MSFTTQTQACSLGPGTAPHQGRAGDMGHPSPGPRGDPALAEGARPLPGPAACTTSLAEPSGQKWTRQAPCHHHCAPLLASEDPSLLRGSRRSWPACPLLRRSAPVRPRVGQRERTALAWMSVLLGGRGSIPCSSGPTGPWPGCWVPVTHCLPAALSHLPTEPPAVDSQLPWERRRGQELGRTGGRSSQLTFCFSYQDRGSLFPGRLRPYLCLRGGDGAVPRLLCAQAGGGGASLGQTVGVGTRGSLAD